MRKPLALFALFLAGALAIAQQSSRTPEPVTPMPILKVKRVTTPGPVQWQDEEGRTYTLWME